MSERLPVKKTYKLFVGGKFPRSESGRTFEAQYPHIETVYKDIHSHPELGF